MGWHACILCVIWNDLMWPMLLYRLQHNGTHTVSIYSSCSLLYRKKVVTPISVLCPLQSREIFMPWWFICVLKEGILLSLSFKISQVLHFVGGFFLLESCCYIIHFFFTSGSVCAEHAGLCQSHHLSACLSRIKHAPMVFFCMCLTCRIHYFWNRWKKLRVVVSCVASKMCV